jgi:hypothetical protein
MARSLEALRGEERHDQVDREAKRYDEAEDEFEHQSFPSARA